MNNRKKSMKIPLCVMTGFLVGLAGHSVCAKAAEPTARPSVEELLTELEHLSLELDKTGRREDTRNSIRM